MPAASAPPAGHHWRQSWPPVQLYLQQEGSASEHAQQEDATDAAQPPRSGVAAKLDSNPMSYFLAPPRPLLDYDDDDEMDDDDLSSSHTDISDIDLDMDAGIEDASRPHPNVRAISPSSLEKHHTSGSHMLLRHRTASLLRPPTPPRQSVKADYGNGFEDDEDGDDYVRFGMAVPVSIPTRPSSATTRTMPYRSDPYAIQSARNSTAALSVSPAATRHLLPVGRPVRRRSPRSWRVPSPTVFSIEEEMEQDEEQQREDLPVRKQVRFVLPHEEV